MDSPAAGESRKREIAKARKGTDGVHVLRRSCLGKVSAHVDCILLQVIGLMELTKIAQLGSALMLRET
jgi:hypothetical protein